EVDDWWAGLLRLPAAAVRAGGVFPLGHVDHAGVVAVEGACAPIVYGPPGVLPALHAAVRAGGGELAGGRAGELAAALGARAGEGQRWGRARARCEDPPGTATPQPRALARHQARPYGSLTNESCRCWLACTSRRSLPSARRAGPRGCPPTATSMMASCWRWPV